MESIYSSLLELTRVDGILNLEVGVSRIQGHPGYQEYRAMGGLTDRLHHGTRDGDES